MGGLLFSVKDAGIPHHKEDRENYLADGVKPEMCGVKSLIFKEFWGVKKNNPTNPHMRGFGKH